MFTATLENVILVTADAAGFYPNVISIPWNKRDKRTIPTESQMKMEKFYLEKNLKFGNKTKPEIKETKLKILWLTFSQ